MIILIKYNKMNLKLYCFFVVEDIQIFFNGEENNFCLVYVLIICIVKLDYCIKFVYKDYFVILGF